MNTFNLEDSLGYLVAKTNWYMKSYFNKLIKDNGLNVTTEQWAVLVTIYNKPGISQTEIAKLSLKDKANITRILDGLDKNGYVIKTSDSSDRRAYNINLTDSGKEVLEKLIPLAQQANNAFVQDLSQREVENLVNSLNKIPSTLERLITD